MCGIFTDTGESATEWCSKICNISSNSDSKYGSRRIWRWRLCSICTSVAKTVIFAALFMHNLWLLYPFNGLFSRTTWESRHQKGRPFWILLEQETMGWQWHHLDHIQIICTSLQTDNHAIASPFSFYRPDALSVTQPTASKHWRHNLTINVGQCPTWWPPCRI